VLLYANLTYYGALWFSYVFHENMITKFIPPKRGKKEPTPKNAYASTTGQHPGHPYTINILQNFFAVKTFFKIFLTFFLHTLIPTQTHQNADVIPTIHPT